MNVLEYWSRETNPETGEKFESFRKYLECGNNGHMDVDGFVKSQYGQEFARRLKDRFTYEDDSMGEKTLEFYRALGLKKELFEDEDFFTRWAILTPLEMYEPTGAGKKYPLVISLHGSGSSIETDEFSTGYNYLAGKEGFMVVYPQNTNRDNLLRIIDIISKKYPLDTERVYMTGFSQGGHQTNSFQFRHPEKLAAVALGGNDIYREKDNFDVPYTEEELEHFKETFVPFMLMDGMTETSSFLPLNSWRPRRSSPNPHTPETHFDPRHDENNDPTHIHEEGRGHRDPENLAKGIKWTRSTPPTPPEGTDVHQWMMERFNRRMRLLGCKERDAEKCIGFLNTPEDELHYAVGVYGDEERIDEFYGYKHYTVDIWNEDGIHAFRFITVENCPHWPYVTMGERCWEFLKKFRRDTSTGKIVEDEYRR